MEIVAGNVVIECCTEFVDVACATHAWAEHGSAGGDVSKPDVESIGSAANDAAANDADANANANADVSDGNAESLDDRWARRSL